ncbi:(2Fe-2S)-binding protein [Methyloprofundus sp.]|uniref:(2Fe-2S)-binding protein n=1 Tax=Methyloprofundus sp. TaxID=2020875 RepID=UPI003D1295E9
MNASSDTQQETIICTCTGTSREKIEQLIAKGADTLDKIESATGANTGCGSCDILILELLTDKNPK